MATAITIKRNIAKLEAALKSKATPKSLKSKLETQLVKSKAELSALSKGSKPKTSSTKSTQTTLEKLKAMVKKKKFSVYQGKNVDLKKDAEEGALAVGRRVSKGLKGNQFGDKKSSKGHVYYEYRANRLDVKQPKKAQKYPKLEDGGMMAKGGEVVQVKDYYIIPNYDGGYGSFESKQEGGMPFYVTNREGNIVYKAESILDAKEYIEDRYTEMKKGGYMADGGVNEKEVVESNAEMVLSKIKEVHHHADELGDIVSKKSDIEAWVVAKIERASTDLSDITHYLDGQHQKMALGGELHRNEQ